MNDERIRLYGWMTITLVVLGVTALLSALVSGFLVTVIGVVVYGFAFQPSELPRVSALLPIACIAAVGVLAVLVWSERSAPDHAVRSIGASPAAETDHSELIDTVRRVAQQVGVPMPEVYVAPASEPFSLTTGFRLRTARLVVSEGALSLLERAELEAVVAHEIAHVANRDAAVMTAVSLPISAAGRVFRLFSGSNTGVEHGQPSRAGPMDLLVVVGLIQALPVWIVAICCWAALARSREFAADSGAVAITGDLAALATALEKIDTTLSEKPSTDLRNAELSALAIVEAPRERADIGGVPLPVPMRRFRRLVATHPSTERRLERLRRTAASGAPRYDVANED
ncbi:M48 family metallopeptidase [Haloterrigena salifodinae]|uniref:M48 family metallopeptidase n=1 Tax=Haloterrigena salifodinae TaxID=2675099 RepID=UPI000F869A99|nr:M48 family metalloprotease [Haloterrigena salifodinae]